MTRLAWIRPIVATALAALVLGAVPACEKEGLRKVEVPSSGIRLAYDLTTGSTYQGHVKLGNTQQIEGAGNVSQSLECDVKLVVIGDDPQRGGAQVRATVSNVDLKWGLPPSVPVSPDEFLQQALAQLQGMSITFNVLPTGEIVHMPSPPQELSEELRELVYQVVRALEQGFLVVPKHAVKDGETWTENERKGREGKLGRFVEGKVETKVDGMFHDDERKEDVVRLVIQEKRKEIVTTKDGARASESERKSTALFATTGYLAEVDGETREYDPKQGMNFRKLSVRWRRTAQGQGTAAPADVQTIADPCHPDYVGPAECTEGETQAITDPCHPDYVGAEECAAGAAPEGGTPPAGTPPSEPAPK